MRQIQTDISSFDDIRAAGLLYVDKTDYVHRLTTSGMKACFLSRPRRFGKSLLVSTLKAYFLGKRQLFEGLRLAELQPGEWEAFPVIHLDMAQGSSRKSLEETERKMQVVVADAAAVNGIALAPDSPAIMLNTLMRRLREKSGRQVVVLIDEYDKPILDALQTEWAEKAVALCQEFYQNLKSNQEIERFVFLTGVSKFAHTSLFSGFNNPTDISRDKEYAAILGYTKEELLGNFSEHLDLAAAELDLDREALVERIGYWYDGHRFTISPTTLYNPVSIGQFLTKRSFQNFWVETGTPSFLVSEVRNNPFELDQYRDEWFTLDDFGKYDIAHLNPMSLAIQTGYMSISAVSRLNEQYVCKYDYPNFEIRQSWSKEMMRLAFTNADVVIGKNMRLQKALAAGDCEDFMLCLRHIFAGASYENIGGIQVNEGYYRNMIYMLFSAFNIQRAVEEHTATGRLDFAAGNSSHAYIMELKVRSGSRDSKALIREAFAQAEEGRYAEKYRLLSRQVHLIAAVFDRDTHQLIDWEAREA